MDKPIFGFTLTSACNLKCSFCYNKFCRITALSLADVIKGYSSIKHLDCTLSFIGGEPLLLPWFEACLRLPKPMLVYTNGVLLDEHYTKFRNAHFMVSPHTAAMREKGIDVDEYFQKLRRLRQMGINISLVIVSTDEVALRYAMRLKDTIDFDVVVEFNQNHDFKGLDTVNEYGPQYLYNGNVITLDQAVALPYTGCRSLDFEYSAETHQFMHSCTNEPLSDVLIDYIRQHGIDCEAGRCWLDCWLRYPKNELNVIRRP